MVTKSPSSRPAKATPATPVKEPVVEARAVPKRGQVKGNGTAWALGALVFVGGAGYIIWQYDLADAVMGPAPVVKALPNLAKGEPLPSDAAVIDLVEEATPVTTSDEALPSTSRITPLEAISGTVTATAVIPVPGAGVVLPPPPAPIIVKVKELSPRSELASQLALLISAAQAGLTTTPQLAQNLLPWAEAQHDAGLVALLTPLANPPAVATETPQGPEWLSRWVKVSRGKPATSTVDPAVLEALTSYYLTHYLHPAVEDVPAVPVLPETNTLNATPTVVVPNL